MRQFIEKRGYLLARSCHNIQSGDPGAVRDPRNEKKAVSFPMQILLDDDRPGHHRVIRAMIGEGPCRGKCCGLATSCRNVAGIPDSRVTGRRVRHPVVVLPGYCGAFGNGETDGAERHTGHGDGVRLRLGGGS